MQRRKFITLLGGAVVSWPLAARAQQTKVYRIGALLIGNAEVNTFRAELQEGLRQDGYDEGRDVLFEFRIAEEKLDRLPKLAAELVALRIDVIVALYTPCALAAQQATREIPIVAVSADPIATGLVASLARPGGNITGISLLALDTICFPRYIAWLPSVTVPTPPRSRSLNTSSVRGRSQASRLPLPSWCVRPVRSMHEKGRSGRCRCAR